jgi:hypothetical protein
MKPDLNCCNAVHEPNQIHAAEDSRSPSQRGFEAFGRSTRSYWLCLAAWLWATVVVPAQTNVLTWHNDLFRTGQNTNETVLVPANVNTNNFGLLFNYIVDGDVYAQPLYVSGLLIPGLGTRNVVFVATQHDSVYAFDADSNAGINAGVIWHVSLGTSAVTPNNDFGNRYGAYHDIDPEVGITSTPVIDLASGTIFVDAFTHEGSSYFHRIHALDIVTGAEKAFSPVVVTASVPGVGVGSSNGVVIFDPLYELQRPALTLAGGKLYVCYSGYADTDPYHGWILGFNANNLQLPTNSIFNDTPNSTVASFGANAGEGGIWMSGSGLGVDANTNLYVVIGNGSYNANTGGTEYGDSALRLSTTNGLAVADYFTPFNQATLAINDTDFGSGGPLLLPDAVGSVAHPHLMVACGKEGRVYLLDRDNLGHYNAAANATSDPQIIQELPGAVGGTWSSPGYFNHRVYFQGSSDVLKAFALANGQFVATPVSQSTTSFGFPGATPAFSANGTNHAIAWVIQSDAAESGGIGVLHAYDAYNLGNELYNSSQAGIRDVPAVAVKFTIPTVINGKVYVGARKTLAVYGNGTFIAVPTISPNGGYFTNSVSITVADGTPGTTIYYTLDGTTPGTNSPIYSVPLTITNTAVLNVKALKSGAVPGPVVSATFINSASTNFYPGFAKQEFYSGALRTDLENIAYSAPPTFVQYLNSFETPSGQGNDYAERVSGFFIPPVTTNYVFFISADDDADLFLSTNAAATNKHLIAQETAWSNSREWVSSAGGSALASKRSDQFSGTTWPGGNMIQLAAGTRYYLEGVHHQGTGGDDFAVTFKYSGAADPADGTAPLLTGSAIGVVAYNNTFIKINSSPQNAVGVQGNPVTFSVSATSGYLGNASAAGPAITYQWQSAPAGSLTFTNISNANATAYTTPPLTLAQNGAQFRAVLTTAGATTNSAVATVTVVPDSHPPVPIQVVSVSANARAVGVAFSESLDPSSAQMATNYVFTPGNLTATSATLDATGTNVLVTVATPLPQSTSLTLAIANVKDAEGNPVPPGTTISFSFVLTGSSGFASAVLADGPLAWWRLNEAAGTTAFDVTGAFNGTYASAAILGVAGPQPPVFGGFESTNTGTQFQYGLANSFATVPALNFTTNAVTFLAWLYPIGNQASYSGLLMTRNGTQAGLGYTTANQVGYTWNNNSTWTFQSGLVPPANQWSLVALVIAPAQATLYVINTSGVFSATNAIAHQTETWNGTAQIGNDAAGGSGSRTFNGVMDEVTVFNKSLSLSSLTALYQSATQGSASITNGPVGPVALRFTSINAVAGQVVLQWTGTGTLEEAPSVTGPWITSTNQASPQIIPMAGTKFYRLHQ